MSKQVKKDPLKFLAKVRKTLRDLPEDQHDSVILGAPDFGLSDAEALTIYKKEKETQKKFSETKQPIGSQFFQSAAEFARARFMSMDVWFIQKHPDIVKVKMGENISVYAYKNGVHTQLSNEDTEMIVSNFLVDEGLNEFRTRNHVKDTIANIKSRLPIAWSMETIAEQKPLLNLKNGLLEPETRVLSPHTMEYFDTTQIPFEYVDDRKTEPKKWIQFITKAFDGNKALIDFMQEIFGYCLTPDTSHHAAFFFYSELRGTGKSTCADVLRKLVGEKNTSAVPISQLATGKHAISTLLGKRLNVSDEIDTRYIESSIVSSLVSSEPVTIDIKYQMPITIRPKVKFIFTTNTLPNYASASGMSRRTFPVPFNHLVTEEERIYGLAEKLVHEEASHILNWALDGLDRLRKRGSFKVPQEVLDEIAQYKQESSSIEAYLSDPDYITINKNSDYVGARELYGEKSSKDFDGTGYLRYCEKSNMKPMSFLRFSKELSRFVMESKGTLVKRLHNNKNEFSGISIAF